MTMHLPQLRGFLVALALTALLPAHAAESDRWTLPIEVKRFDNGLTVVVSEDHGSPTFGMSVVYEVGMRREPRNRTGFAHLFEHLMFEGTPNAPSGTLTKVIQGGGGVLNGSTRADYTNYIESAPVTALEPILWLEADRMKTLDFNAANLKNQQDVVKEEIRVNVKNQPYGLFFWTDMIALAFDKWENEHDGYGSFVDLENAQLDDVRAFHRDYYGPNNAVIGIAGDVDAEQVFALIEKYFGDIPARPTPAMADFSEPLNDKPRRLDQTDALAQVPALALGWKMPARGHADHVPMAVLSRVLVGDDASQLYQGLVKGRSLAVQVDGGMNWPLGDAFDFDGPTLFTLFALYKPNANADQVVSAVEEEVAALARDGVDAAVLARVKTKMVADYYNELDLLLSRADHLAKMQALWGDAAVANRIPDWIAAVEAADVQRVAHAYLTANNRTVIDRKPALPAAAAPAAK
jgi:predicted Zn-dependent peptidase